jgi:hypothetical protein
VLLSFLVQIKKENPSADILSADGFLFYPIGPFCSIESEAKRHFNFKG